MAGMNPTMSSCLMLASLPSLLRARICPCSLYSLRSPPLSPQAAHQSTHKASASEKITCFRIQLVYSHSDDLDRNVGLQLPGMEGEFLSGESPRGEDASVLRRALFDGRDQLHLLPDAEREARGRLVRRDAVPLQADTQGAASDHPRQPSARLRR